MEKLAQELLNIFVLIKILRATSGRSAGLLKAEVRMSGAFKSVVPERFSNEVIARSWKGTTKPLTFTYKPDTMHEQKARENVQVNCSFFRRHYRLFHGKSSASLEGCNSWRHCSRYLFNTRAAGGTEYTRNMPLDCYILHVRQTAF